MAPMKRGLMTPVLLLGALSASGCSPDGTAQPPAATGTATTLAASPETPWGTLEPIRHHTPWMRIGPGTPAAAAISPDGRWVVVRRLDAAAAPAGLWILPTSGGEPVRITDEGAQPSWSQAGDRIFYNAQRGATGQFIMSLPMDPATGRPAGTPRQVTLDGDARFPRPSPDGTMLAYRAGRSEDREEIRVVPSNGGNSRLVAAGEIPSNLMLEWSPDGSAIFFVRDAPGSTGLFRVPVSGGGASVVVSFDDRTTIHSFSPANQRVSTTVPGHAEGQSILQIHDFSGRVIARADLPMNARPFGFTADGQRLLGYSWDAFDSVVVRVKPIMGGDARDLAAGRYGYDVPVGWTADSRRVIVRPLDAYLLLQPEVKRVAARILPLDGGPARVVPTPEEDVADAWWEPRPLDSTTPDQVAYMVLSTDRETGRLVALDLATGARTLLSANARRELPCCGGAGSGEPGGFLFTEEVEGRIETRSVRPGSPAITLHARPKGSPSVDLAIHGQRIAFREVIGDSVMLMLADPWNATPRVIANLGPAEVADVGRCCMGPTSGALAFSPDGRRLAVHPYEPVNEVILLTVPEQGRASEVRRIPVTDGPGYWLQPQWLPDGSGFTVTTNNSEGVYVAFVPIAASQPARTVARGTPYPGDPSWHHEVWFHSLSPDGRWVAYSEEVQFSHGLWTLDIGAVTPGGR
ncbi:hypothetical protein BH23GEM9_BH23GEM9_04500 [soil metagenome]